MKYLEKYLEKWNTYFELAFCGRWSCRCFKSLRGSLRYAKMKQTCPQKPQSSIASRQFADDHALFKLFCSRKASIILSIGKERTQRTPWIKIHTTLLLATWASEKDQVCTTITDRERRFSFECCHTRNKEADNRYQQFKEPIRAGFEMARDFRPITASAVISSESKSAFILHAALGSSTIASL